jgi:hypothetical protein
MKRKHCHHHEETCPIAEVASELTAGRIRTRPVLGVIQDWCLSGKKPPDSPSSHALVVACQLGPVSTWFAGTSSLPFMFVNSFLTLT